MHNLRGKTVRGMWQRLWQSAASLGDKITESTGWAAMRVPLARASGPRQVTLDIPGYVQTNSYCCGAVAAVMVVRYFSLRMSFGTIYAAVEPEPDLGASTARVTQGLRACGITVAKRHKLSFRDLCEAINSGSPILVVIYNPGAASRHWGVVYGYGRHPDVVFVAGNSIPWIGRNPISRSLFESLWQPNGNGLVCRKTKSKRRRAASRAHAQR